MGHSRAWHWRLARPERSRRDFTVQLTSRHRLALVVACVATASAPLASAITGGAVHTGFLGEWVPAAATCTSPLKLVIGANRVAFTSGADRAEYTKLEQCFSCAGQGVEGVTMLSTDAMGDSPFMITLDESRKRRTSMTVDLDKKLAARFPFGTKSLKKCP